MFAVMMRRACIPILHLGRPWSSTGCSLSEHHDVWPQFKSPLLWDFGGVATYLIVSVLFWYIGLVPDLAAGARPADAAPGPAILRPAGARLARLGHPLAALAAQAYRTCSRRSRCRWSSRCTSACRCCSPPAPCPAGIRHVFPPYFVLGAIYLWLRHGIADHGRPARPSPSRTSSPTATSIYSGGSCSLTGFASVSYGIPGRCSTLAWFWGDWLRAARPSPSRSPAPMPGPILGGGHRQRGGILMVVVGARAPQRTGAVADRGPWCVARHLARSLLFPGRGSPWPRLLPSAWRGLHAVALGMVAVSAGTIGVFLFPVPAVRGA